MTDKGWSTRLHEAGVAPVRATWSEVWPIMVRAQAGCGTAALKAWLWQHRHASWLASLNSDDCSCRYCGGLKPGDRKARLFCSDACRVSAHQASSRGSEWPLARTTRLAHEDLHRLALQHAEAEAWLDREGSRGILPPDLASLDNLPPLPDLCRDGCAGKPCFRTRGGPCLYANTAQET